MPSGSFPACFFFQAEDGIRDYKVTGVQTCALPISDLSRLALRCFAAPEHPAAYSTILRSRSEERRVGKECRTRGSREQQKKKRQKQQSRRDGCRQTRTSEQRHGSECHKGSTEVCKE